jgi:hypothetical protein
MIECELEIVYLLNGKMTHKNQRSQATINTLNLRARSLESKRKQVIDLILFTYVDDLVDLALEENYYLESIIEELVKPDSNGKLEAFSPVIVNVIKHFIS